MASLACILAVMLALMALAHAVPVAPSKDWCKVSSTSAEQKKYGLFPSGQCAKCEFTVLAGNHCNDFIGEVCPEGPVYNIVNKGQYRFCVCGKSWYGSPKGDKAGKDVSFGGSDQAGCALCPIFGTGSANNATTVKQCSLCRKSLLYTGTGPFCQWNPTAFTKPDCSIPNWDTNGARVKGKCVCKAGFFGTWPDCRSCPPGLTAPAGNGKTCSCDPKQGFVAKSKSKPAVCKCNTAGGFYPMLPSKNSTNCVLCKKQPGGAVVTTKDGVKRCGCNASKGYGINIAPAGPTCVKCSNVGAKLDPKTGECRCTKAGEGVEPAYNPFEEYPDYRKYCVPCTQTGHRVNSKGFCSCKPGFARTSFVSDRGCIPCSKPNMTPVLHPDEYPQPICGCKPGYDGTIFSDTDGTCRKCEAGQFADSSKPGSFGSGWNNFCTCKDPHTIQDNAGPCSKCEDGYVRDKKTKRCVMSAACKASRWTARIWVGSALPKSWNGTFFPKEILDKKVKPTRTITLSSLSATFPDSKVKVGSRFVVVLDAVLWGKKVAPLWLGAGSKRFVPNSRMIAQSGSSKVAIFQGTVDPSSFNSFANTPVAYGSVGVGSYGDSCRTVRLQWWGIKSGATLKLRLLRDQSAPGASL